MTENPYLDALLDRATECGAVGHDANLDGVRHYATLLLNSAGGLSTGDRSPEAVAAQLEDCLAALTIPGIEWTGRDVTDIGSGQGLPGLLLALVRPDIGSVRLIERKARRATLLRRLALELNVAVDVIEGCAPEIFRNGAVETGDISLLRAFGPPPLALDAAVPATRPNGVVLLWLGQRNASREGEISRYAEAIGGEFTVFRGEMLESRGWLAIIHRSRSADEGRHATTNG